MLNSATGALTPGCTPTNGTSCASLSDPIKVPGGYKAAIQEDVQAGQRAGVTGTPAFFINGRFVNGSVSESQFEEIINSELAALKNKTDRADLATR